MKNFVKGKWRGIAIVLLLIHLVAATTVPLLADVVRVQPPSTTDHGLLEGLADDDHSQYLLVADLENPPTEDGASKAPTSEWAFDHDAATTGVHGVGAETILHTGDVGTMAAETATDYLAIADLENPPIEDEASAAPTSEWAFDHDADGTAHQSNVITITLLIDGGGSAITTGEHGHLEIPFACTITGWTLLGDQSGSIVIDVWNDTYANFPPAVADTIAGSEKPTLSAVQKNQDLTLSTWTTAVSAGNILAFNVDSAATVTRVTLSIRATKT